MMTEKDRMDLGRRRREQRARRRKRCRRRALLVFLAAMALTGSVKTAQLSQTAGERDLPRNSREITAVSPAKAPESVKPPEPAGGERAAERPEDWRLLLVNPWKTLPEGYTVELQKVKGGHAVDARVYPDLQRMLDDCRAAGLRPLICSSYRSQETQQRLYENKIRRLMREGLSREEATAQAGTVVAVPGTSEHQTGLAVDLVDKSYQHLDDAQASTDVQQWLMENSWKYGFILRYPEEKSDVTGIIYEPWHYRYVGEPAAREMRELGLCLEEYIEWLGETGQ
nr:M15 family metallopeptidase [uncultured Dysosmobacter sp.]